MPYSEKIPMKKNNSELAHESEIISRKQLISVGPNTKSEAMQHQSEKNKMRIFL